MEDCSKKGKKVLISIILLLSTILLLKIIEYINIVIFMMYLLFVLYFFTKSIFPYVYCIMGYDKLGRKR